MPSFKFIHAADLHLDVPMQKISNELALSSQATFQALENLVKIAVQKQVDAVLFVGDIWNDEDASLRARLMFKKACDTLNKHCIKVYIAHGNHDPLTKRFQSIQYPENVVLFPSEYTVSAFEKQNEILAYIHGISHASKKESTNLSNTFAAQSLASKDKYYHIYMLHTSLTGNEHEDRYAPCSLADLRDKNPHYWALGHIHRFQIIEENPDIVFSGALQGTHINEEGAHGCVYVHLQRDDISKETKIIKEFIPLAPLMWKKVAYTIEDDIADIVELQERIQEYLIEYFELLLNESSQLKEYTKQIVIKLNINGKSVLNKELHKLSIIKEMQESLNEALLFAQTPLYIKEIEVQSIDKEEKKNINELMKADNFLSDVLKKGEELLVCKDEELLLEMEKIYKELPISKAQTPLIPLIKNRQELEKIIIQAQYLCSQLLDPAE